MGDKPGMLIPRLTTRGEPSEPGRDRAEPLRRPRELRKPLVVTALFVWIAVKALGLAWEAREPFYLPPPAGEEVRVEVLGRVNPSTDCTGFSYSSSHDGPRPPRCRWRVAVPGEAEPRVVRAGALPDHTAVGPYTAVLTTNDDLVFPNLRFGDRAVWRWLPFLILVLSAGTVFHTWRRARVRLTGWRTPAEFEEIETQRVRVRGTGNGSSRSALRHSVLARFTDGPFHGSHGRHAWRSLDLEPLGTTGEFVVVPVDREAAARLREASHRGAARDGPPGSIEGRIAGRPHQFLPHYFRYAALPLLIAGFLLLLLGIEVDIATH